MKEVIFTHRFKGCHDGCPYHTDYGVLSPEWCKLSKRRIVGYSSKSCQIPIGKDYPDWCEVPEIDEVSKDPELDQLVQQLSSKEVIERGEELNRDFNRFPVEDLLKPYGGASAIIGKGYDRKLLPYGGRVNAWGKITHVVTLEEHQEMVERCRSIRE